jgi:hypothetical protein
VREPDLVAGSDFRSDRRKANRQIFDQCLANSLVEPSRETFAADQAGAANSDVEISENATHGQRACPFLNAI